MKKTVLLFLGLILFFSCDPTAYYSYHIVNRCNEELKVLIEVCLLNCNTNYSKKDSLSLKINPNSTKLIYTDDKSILPLFDRYVENCFENIIIIKGNDTSKINYVDKDLWEFKKTSKDHADSYLTVYPADFE